ncbi:hypothetical protein RvY_10713 [Ramazzottius varieornatus]|uniref:Uncharacterized protein n=1 Tax=Ramazzottius varieornatus TaxID=947166 RepID=A0A1D1VDN0_RAMVA|nr:hypothetical protein RvY_10713 [Ramazzottius varieornatus]
MLWPARLCSPCSCLRPADVLPHTYPRVSSVIVPFVSGFRHGWIIRHRHGEDDRWYRVLAALSTTRGTIAMAYHMAHHTGEPIQAQSRTY